MASLIKREFKNVPIWYIQFYQAGKQRRIRASDSFQIAKEKLRRFESAQAKGEALPLPTCTPIADVVTAYVNHIRTAKTAKSAQTDIYYLREVFGSICEALQVTSRKLTPKMKKRPAKPGQDRRFKAPAIEADCFERISTSEIAAFISSRKQSRGLAPKTANRYREILVRLFNWATTQHGIRLPSDKNPAAAVEKYAEPAPEIRFLTLEQIDQQLAALAEKPQLQAMAATLIFAGIRREELLWLTLDDVDLGCGPFGILRIRAKTIDEDSWQPKTKVNRAVPIGSRLRPYIDKFRLKLAGSKWLFPSPEGKRWIPDNFSADLRAANEKAGLAWGCLDYRHTFGSQLAMKGESLYKIAKLLGNSPEICRRHYAALLPEEMGETVEFGVRKEVKGQQRSEISE